MPAIIFRPDYMSQEYKSNPLYQKEDVFHVKVNGLTAPVEYIVKLFDLTEIEKIQNTEPRE
jgi:hypothetical protein